MLRELFTSPALYGSAAVAAVIAAAATITASLTGARATVAAAEAAAIAPIREVALAELETAITAQRELYIALSARLDAMTDDLADCEAGREQTRAELEALRAELDELRRRSA